MKFILIYSLLSVPYPPGKDMKWWNDYKIYVRSETISSFKDRSFNLCEPAKGKNISYETLKNCKKVDYCEVDLLFSETHGIMEYPGKCEILQKELK